MSLFPHGYLQNEKFRCKFEDEQVTNDDMKMALEEQYGEEVQTLRIIQLTPVRELSLIILCCSPRLQV